MRMPDVRTPEVTGNSDSSSLAWLPSTATSGVALTALDYKGAHEGLVCNNCARVEGGHTFIQRLIYPAGLMIYFGFAEVLMPICRGRRHVRAYLAQDAENVVPTPLVVATLLIFMVSLDDKSQKFPPPSGPGDVPGNYTNHTVSRYQNARIDM